jgi:hypothetical protein
MIASIALAVAFLPAVYAQGGSVLLAPANGATVYPQNVQFSWTAVAGALSYTLSVGSTPGASDALSFSTASTANPSGTTSTTANLNAGQTYYVTVQTQTASGSTSSTSSFQTFPASYLISPASGATVSPQNVQFNWTAVPGVLSYTLWVGTAPGTQDALYYTTAHLANPAAVTSTTANLPAGVTLYATMTTKTASLILKTTSTFQTTATSYLISPANGATVYPQNVQFSWTAVPGVLSYSLSVGSTPGASDALSFSTASTSNPSGTTSTTANLNPGQSYYVTVQTQTASGSASSTSSFQTYPASYLISPASGATVSPQNVQFNWTTVPGVLSYTLWVGTAPGTQDALYYTTAHLANPAAVTSTTANLPVGVTLYATMTTKTAGASLKTTSTFQTTATSYLISPANGATVSPQNTQFNWTAVPGALSYTLSVGSTPGASDALSFSTASTSNPSGTTSTTANLNPGATYYTTVTVQTATGATSSASSFQTKSMAYVTSPASGGTGISQFAQFTWTAVPGATTYLLAVSPTKYNGKDNFREDFAGSVNSGYVWNLQPNTLYYVSLYTQTATGAATSFSTFTTGTNPLPAARSSFYNTILNLTAQVRQSAAFPGNLPLPGGILYQNMLMHTDDPTKGAACVNFAKALADLLTANSILVRGRDTTFDGADAHSVPEYWDPFNAKWQIADPTFGVMYLNPTTGVGQGVEDLNALLLSGNLAGITPMWVTNSGSLYATTYFMNPILYFNNPFPFGEMEEFQQVYDNVPNSPLPFLQEVDLSAANHPTGVYIVWFANSTDQVTINNAGTQTTVSPLSAAGWALSTTLYSPWTIASPIPDGMKIYTMIWPSGFPVSNTASLITPAAGAHVSAHNISFSWTPVSGATAFQLWIGTTPGARDVYSYTTANAPNPGSVTSAVASVSATGTYYVTLFTQTASGTTNSTSSFEATVSSYLTAPADGATVSPQNVQFTWTTAPGALNYTLWIGTTPKAQDVLYYSTAQAGNPAALTSTTANLPSGVTLYATLWTQTSSGYTSSASTFQTSAVSYLTAPANGAAVSPLNTQFIWTAVPGVINYTLWLGSTPGAKDVLYYTTAHLANPTAVTSTTANLPSGATLYATLWTLTSSGYVSSASSFQTASYLTAPANGATVSPQNAQFSWTASPGALNYTLWIGTTPKAQDVLYYTTAHATNPAAVTSTTANLPAGVTLYATLWTQTSSGYTSSASTFQTLAVSYLSSPASGATVSALNTQFNWTAVPGVINYTLWIGSTPKAKDVLYYTTAHLANPAAVTSTTANLPGGTTLYATLWTLTSSGNVSSTSSFQTTSTPYLSAPANGATVSPLNTQFSWTTATGALNYTLWIGTSPKTQNVLYYTTAHLANPAAVTSTTANLPAGVTLYATLSTQTSSGYTTSTSTFQTLAVSYLTAPANGATVSALNTQFNWTAVPGVINYTLWLGSTPGAQDVLWYSTAGTSNPTGITSTVANLNAGTTYYATLWTLTSSGYTKSASTFQTAATSYLTAPANGATVAPQNIQFNWTPVPGVINYTLWLGSTPRAKDVLYYTTAHASNPAAITSTTANLQPGTTYYATLWTLSASGSTSTTTTFQTAVISYLTSPVNGATVFPQNIPFSWTASPGAMNYTIWVGTTPGAQNVLYYSTASTSNPAGTTSTTATLPPGATYYVSLWTKSASGGYQMTSSSFQTSATAVLTAPANGAANLDPAVPISFTWAPIGSVTSYELMLGSSAGANNYYDSGAITTTSISASLSPNTTYYARLLTNLSGTITHSDTIFATGYALAHLTYPLNGTAGVSQFLPLTWSQARGATGYILGVSLSNNFSNSFFWSSGTSLVPTDTSQYVWPLQPGTTYYVQLCTVDPAPAPVGCVHTNFTTGAALAPPTNQNQFYQTIIGFTSQVNLMSQGFSHIPASGTALYDELLSYGKDPSQGALCGDYVVTLLNILAQNNILGRMRSISLDGIDGHVVAEFWDPFNQQWDVADPFYGLVYLNQNLTAGQSAEQISALLLAGNYSSIDTNFVTPYGDRYMTTYYLDPMTYYTNVVPFGMISTYDELNTIPNSPLQFLHEVDLNDEGQTGFYVFNFANQTDSVTIQDQGGAETLTPANTEGWVADVYLHPGWTITSGVPSGMRVFTFVRAMF